VNRSYTTSHPLADPLSLESTDSYDDLPPAAAGLCL